MLAALSAQKIFGGIDLGRWFADMDDCFLIAVTERHTKADLDRFVEALKAIG
jgi:glycine dehydrogenase subunit 1